MRKVIVSNLVSLDGYIAAPDGDLSWFAVGPEFFRYAQGLMQSVDTLLFGRVTYEMMEAYWTGPDAAAQNDEIVTRRMNELPKVVFSRRLGQAKWGRWNNARVAADPAGELRRLKARAGGDMVIFGSGGLVSALTAAGLIDEYRFIVNPSILGGGVPMFRGVERRVPLKLVSNHVYDGNVVMLTYHPAGTP